LPNPIGIEGRREHCLNYRSDCDNRRGDSRGNKNVGCGT